MRKPYYQIVTIITFYRLLVTPVLLLLVILHNQSLFSLLLPLSFFSDLLDGYLARRFSVKSSFGSRLDSIADDLTIIVSLIALFVFKPAFVEKYIVLLLVMLALLALETVLSLLKYGKMSSFHTYMAKGADLLQGCFLIFFFFFDYPNYVLFYAMVIVTIADLLEEIALVIILPQWKTDVKGIIWQMHESQRKQPSPNTHIEQY